MTLSVKGIFKVLLGTVVLMVVISLVIEMLNITTTALQLNQMAKIACRQSAVLLSQETYKERGSTGGNLGGSTSLETLRSANGTEYVNGNVYGAGTNAEQIYRAMYTSPEFKAWVKSPEIMKGRWKSIDLINRALNNPGSLNVSMPSSMSDAAMEEYTDAMVAKSYRDVMMTPLNMGVPYLDSTVLNRIFKWNLTQMASDCNSDLIRQDASGNYCVFYKGFRVYASQARITNISYKVFDLSKDADAKDFRNMTHIDPEKLGFDDSLIDYMGGYKNDDERKRVCVVGLEFTIPIGYEGITPIKNIFNFVWNNEVEGMDGNQGQAEHYQWNDATANLESGGFGGVKTPAGVLPVPGKLIYYVVR